MNNAETKAIAALIRFFIAEIGWHAYEQTVDGDFIAITPDTADGRDIAMVVPPSPRALGLTIVRKPQGGIVLRLEEDGYTVDRFVGVAGPYVGPLACAVLVDDAEELRHFGYETVTAVYAALAAKVLDDIARA